MQYLSTIEINVARSVLPIGPGILDIRVFKEHILREAFLVRKSKVVFNGNLFFNLFIKMRQV